MLSYFGYMEDASDLMQKISNKSRAHFINAQRLRGFLDNNYVIHILNKAVLNGDLEAVTKHHIMDVKTIIQKLETFDTNK